jgi:hypothetical protein
VDNLRFVAAPGALKIRSSFASFFKVKKLWSISAEEIPCDDESSHSELRVRKYYCLIRTNGKIFGCIFEWQLTALLSFSVDANQGAISVASQPSRVLKNFPTATCSLVLEWIED